MSAVSIERVKDRIRKLMNLAANDAAAAGEVDNALRFAQNLMAQHHLSEDEIREDEPLPAFNAVSAEMGRVYCSVGAKVYFWELSLVNFVTKFVGGVKFYTDSGKHTARTPAGFAMAGGGTGKRFAFYGVAEDTMLAAELFHELRTTIIATARLKFGSVYKGDGAAYSEGFVKGLQTKLEAVNEAARLTQASGGRGLAIVQARGAMITAKIRAAEKYARCDLGLNLQYSARRGGTGTGSSGARGEGYSDGRRSSVSASRAAKISYR